MKAECALQRLYARGCRQRWAGGNARQRQAGSARCGQQPGASLVGDFYTYPKTEYAPLEPKQLTMPPPPPGDRLASSAVQGHGGLPTSRSMRITRGCEYMGAAYRHEPGAPLAPTGPLVREPIL